MTSPDRARRSPEEGLEVAKSELRTVLRARREGRRGEEREAADLARTDALMAWLEARVRPGSAVALYCSQSPEPDTAALISWLCSKGVRVLLPVLGPREDGTPRREPDWAWYSGPDAMRVGLWGIPEPVGPSLGAAALSDADLVLCSGLSATLGGLRLGAGGGWYDRALEFVRPGAPVVVLLYEEEVLSALPVARWDRGVTAIATPAGVTECSGAGLLEPLAE